MNYFHCRFIFIAFLILQSNIFCSAQADVLLSATPESYSGALDGKLVVTVANPGNGLGQYPPPYVFRLNEIDQDPVQFENTTGTATFTGLGYKYYCLTVVMGNNCLASGCFYFDEACSSGCLIADFDFNFTTNGCTVNFEDWSEGIATSWSWDFGDGSTASIQNPSHTYSESTCYPVTLTISNGSLIRSVTKQVCTAACSGNNSTPACQINGPTVAAAGQTINLSGIGIGIGPFQFVSGWNTGTLDAIPSPITPNISVLLPEDGENDDKFNFSLSVKDYNGIGATCYHEVTLGGNIPDVKVAAFGSFEAGQPLVLAAFVDVLNLTGPETYYFTLKQNDVLIHLDGSCLNTPLDGDWDCTLDPGPEEGFYDLCVDVTDAAGTYSNCIPITIGNPVPPIPLEAMWLEIKPPSDPEQDPDTDHYILEPGTELRIGLNGNHPHSLFNPCTQKEYFTVLHIENITTGEVLTEGYPSNLQPAIMLSQENLPPGLGLGWSYGLGAGCKSGTLKITADVYFVYCDDLPIHFNEDLILFQITKPIYVDIHQKNPVITGISVDNVSCAKPLTVSVGSGCPIVSYEWHIYDPYTNEEVPDFFTDNTDAPTVSPDLNHAFFEQFQEGEIVKFRCKVIVVDVNGFTAEQTSLILLNLPLRVDLPVSITRCGNTNSPLQNTPIAIGGSGNYSINWINQTPSGGNVLSCLNCLDPIVNAPSSGTFLYHTTVVDQSTGCIAVKSIDIKVLGLTASVGPASVSICGSGPGIYNNLGPASALGGSGTYNYSWAPAAYLEDPVSKSPQIVLPTGVTSATFTLTVTDASGCSVVAPSTVQVSTVNNPKVNSLEMGSNISVCHGEAVLLSPDPGAILSPLYYEWHSTNPRFESVQAYNAITLSESDNTHGETNPQTYTYTVRLIDAISGCYKEDALDVTVHGSWKHRGYEPLTWLAVAGSERDLWKKSDDNRFVSPSTNYSANQVNITWNPLTPTDLEEGYGSCSPCTPPENGKFIPTLAIPQTTMLVEHIPTGCVHDYKSIKYLTTESKMDLSVTPGNHMVCAGDEVCFDIKFDLHLLPGQQSAAIPPFVKVSYTIDPPEIGLGQSPITGNVTLNLTSPTGLYTGQLCINDYFTQSFNEFVGLLHSWDYTVKMKVINSKQFGPQQWQEQFQRWIDEDVESALFIKVSDGNYSPPPGVITTCIVEINVEVGTAINLGVGGIPFSIVCSNGTEMHWHSEIRARDYIDIQGHAQISLIPGDQGIGAHLYIDPCIPPGLIGNGDDRNNKEELEEFIERAAGKTDMTVQPNPFTDQIRLLYTLAEPEGKQDLTLSLYDITGKLIQVVEQMDGAENGLYQTDFNARLIPPGTYLYELQIANGKKVVRKAIKFKL